jgi:hypothetical protein
LSKYLTKALNEILAGKITDPDLQMQILQKSDWYSKNTDDYRKFQVYKTRNNTTYLADLKVNAEAIVRQYGQAGINITAQEAVKYAEQMMMKSANINGQVVTYDKNWLTRTMANSIDFTKKKTIGGVEVYDLDGKIETIANSLYKKAWDYGYQASLSNKGFDQWMQNSVRGLVSGDITEDQINADLQDRAVSMFPGLANQIKSGQSLREAANPWLNAIANTWEVDPDTLDLNDDFVNRALNQQDDKGNIVPMNLYQAKTAARKSPKWQYTEKAKEEYTGIGQKILQDFGFMG